MINWTLKARIRRHQAELRGLAAAGPVARGYQVTGTFGLKPAPAIHRSAKSGKFRGVLRVTSDQKAPLNK